MNNNIFAVVAALSLSVSAVASEPCPKTDSKGGAPGAWEVVAQNDRVVVKSRTRAGSDVKEVVAQGKVAVPAWILKNVVDDIEGYPDLIPYTTVARVVDAGKDGRIAFQRLEMPFLQKREYVIRVSDESSMTDDGRHIYKMAWTNADAKYNGLIAKDAVTTPVNDGSWTFEEQADGTSFATFHLFVDPSGALPAVVVNLAQRVTLGQYLGNLEKLAQQARYRTQPSTKVSLR